MVGKLWSVDQIWPTTVLEKSFAGTQPPPFIYILARAAFTLHRQSWRQNRICVSWKPKIHTIQPFKEKVCWPLFYPETLKSLLYFIFSLPVNFYVISERALDFYLIVQLQNIRLLIFHNVYLRREALKQLCHCGCFTMLASPTTLGWQPRECCDEVPQQRTCFWTTADTAFILCIQDPTQNRSQVHPLPRLLLDDWIQHGN